MGKKQYFYFFIFLAINNMIYNSVGDVSSNLSVNITHFIIAGLNIFFLVILFIDNPKIKITPLGKSFLYILPFLLISSILNNSFLGIYNVFLFFEIIIFGSYLTNYSILYEDKLKIVIFFCLVLYLMKMGTRFMMEGVFSFFVPLDKVVVFLLFLSQSLKRYKSKIFFFIALLGRSFSGVSAYFISFIFINYRKLFYLLTIVFVFLFSAINAYLENNVGQVLFYEKSAEHFLTGSGRFDLYYKGFLNFFSSSPFEMIFGSGYMTERSILSGLDLTWSSDPHNAVLRALIGCGFIGLFSLIYIYIKTFKAIVYNNKLKILFFLIIIFSQLNTIYGLKPNETHLLILILAGNYKNA